jgi:hypothetical protein
MKKSVKELTKLAEKADLTVSKRGSEETRQNNLACALAANKVLG